MADPTPVPIPYEYVLELVRGNATKPERVMVLPNVSSFRRSPMPSDRKDYTIQLGKRPIKQSAGIVEEEIRIEGHSGEEERTVTLIDTRQNTSTRTAGGVDLFETLLAFLRDYEADKAKYQSAYSRDSSRRPRMIIRALREGLAFFCDEIRIDPMRAVGKSRFTYEYSISLTTEGEAKDRPPLTLANDPAQALAVSEAALREKLAVDQAVYVERANLATAANITGQAQAASERGFPDSPLGRLAASIPAEFAVFVAPVTKFARQVAEITSLAARATAGGLGFPLDLAANLAAYSEQAISDLFRIWDELTTPLKDRGQAIFARLARAIRQPGRASRRVLGSAGAKRPGPGSGQIATFFAPIEARQGQAVRVVRVGPGEDLQSIAARPDVFGDRDRWRELRDLNGMLSSWQLADGSALGPGTPLRVPVTDGIQVAQEQDPADLYGTDLAWDFRRNDLIASGPNATDFDHVEGPANLRQGCLRRSTMTIGTCRVYPEVGIPVRIGENLSDERAALLGSQTLTQFGREDRIRRVADARLQRIANTVTVSLNLEAVGGETLRISQIGASLAQGE